MKFFSKKLLPVFVVSCVLLSLLIPVFAFGADAPAKGNIVEFGSYPQTQVTDTAEISALTGCIDDDDWQSMNFYSENAKGDFCSYCDFEYEGETYRAVKYSSWRPIYVNEALGLTTWLDNRGFATNTVYFYKFEPIEWTVANTETGLLVCRDAIDSMPVTNTYYSSSGIGYKDSAHTVYANNYEKSDIRVWLNDTFLNTAFTSKQQDAITISEVTNEAYKTAYNAYASGTVYDKVFLPSISDYLAIPKNQHQKAPTDYAVIDGLADYTMYGGDYADYTFWFLRGPGENSNSMAVITPDDELNYQMTAYSTDTAIVPCLCVDFELMNVPEDHTYDGFTFSYENGILTVSGSGVFPDSALSTDKPLSAFSDATVLIIEDGITEIDSGAFIGFSSLGTVIIKSNTAIHSGAFPDSEDISDIFSFKSVQLEEGSFSDISAEFYEWKDAPHSGNLQSGITAHTCNYADETVFVSGSLTLDAYRMLDVISVLCSEHNPVNYFAFDEFTSESIPFCTSNEETGEVTLLEEQTLTNAVFSVKLKTSDGYQSVSFNELTEYASQNGKFSFLLSVKADNEEEIEDSKINVVQRFLLTALKFIVNLLNKLFSLFSKL